MLLVITVLGVAGLTVLVGDLHVEVALAEVEFGGGYFDVLLLGLGDGAVVPDELFEFFEVPVVDVGPLDRERKSYLLPCVP